MTLVWILIGFVSGSIPWAALGVRSISGKSVREVGDGNPGATNAWKSSGWLVGMAVLILDIAKSFIPIYLAMILIDDFSGINGTILLSLIALAPILGHAWSPFLKFKGGKALAPSWGSWMALTNGIALPAGVILLGVLHTIQKNHAITVTGCLVGFLAIFQLLWREDHIGIFWMMNFAIVVYKHKSEYSGGFLLREWLGKYVGRTT